MYANYRAVVKVENKQKPLGEPDQPGMKLHSDGAVFAALKPKIIYSCNYIYSCFRVLIEYTGWWQQL